MAGAIGADELEQWVISAQLSASRKPNGLVEDIMKELRAIRLERDRKRAESQVTTKAE